ncbi:MAG: hypothetical protein IKL14_01770 [Alphaproteobacteria bacterium]|nr:hypothetical protein [Alphaproteobacteria bacterium]
MKKIESVQEFVEKLDAVKKVNPKDLSSDQDLTIAIMNLISIEEHLMFSGAKTGKHEFYDLINEVREMRKNAMLKIIPSYEGEVWCISKHLLAASMRVFEVGTKALAAGDKETAYNLFDQSYGLYCMFWGLNMGVLTAESKNVKVEKTVKKPVQKNLSVSAPVQKTEKTDEKSAMGRLKSWVRNAVNCCIE